MVVRDSDSSHRPFVAEYSAWGEVTGTGLDWMPFGFAGGIYDPDTGLVRFGARDYDPVVGRWTGKDPSGFEGGLNFYAYADNDSVNYVDVEGLEAVDIEVLTKLAHWLGFGGVADMINERRAAFNAVMCGDLDAAECHAMNALEHSVWAVGEIAAVGGSLRAPFGSIGESRPASDTYLEGRMGTLTRSRRDRGNGTCGCLSRLHRTRQTTRPDAVAARLLPQSAAETGVVAYTKTFKSGQVWVFGYKGQVWDAGVNRATKGRGFR